jgi:hypothetical protein
MLKDKWLHRKRDIIHPSGQKFKTPLLVPSLSSKGLNLKLKNKKLVSELPEILSVAAQVIEKAMLVSAFDIHHEFVGKEYLDIAEILFIDSGGYEAAYYDWLKIEKWERSMYKDILDKWDQYIPAIFTSFDHDSLGLPIEKQINREIEFLSRYRTHQMIEMLLKPNKGELYLDINQVIANIDGLNHFSIIGVTEKEIGRTFLERLKFVATLRGQLDRVGNDSPIHIFGCLEPILMVLYFLAGAEIFDGLSWLRYAYIDGRTVYNMEYGVLNLGVDMNYNKLKMQILRNNITFLVDFSINMRKFVDTEDYEVFGKSHMNKIREIHETLYSEL